MLSSLLGTAATVDVRNRRDAIHMREMRLQWPDDQYLIIRLDQGLGFLRSETSLRHDFWSPPAAQTQAIRTATLRVVQSENGAVPLYITGVLQD
ncbi:hypothetical protein ACN28I_38135 [Archangium gephyra]|uniref:hypothetical protein n=1 Tax=Archangium gephyra TaxID=48 RepID=UPI003B7D3B11